MQPTHKITNCKAISIFETIERWRFMNCVNNGKTLMMLNIQWHTHTHTQYHLSNLNDNIFDTIDSEKVFAFPNQCVQLEFVELIFFISLCVFAKVGMFLWIFPLLHLAWIYSHLCHRNEPTGKHVQNGTKWLCFPVVWQLFLLLVPLLLLAKNGILSLHNKKSIDSEEMTCEKSILRTRNTINAVHKLIFPLFLFSSFLTSCAHLQLTSIIDGLVWALSSVLLPSVRL